MMRLSGILSNTRRQLLSKIRTICGRILTSLNLAYEPFIPDRVDIHKLLNEISLFFGRSRHEIDEAWRAYNDFYHARGYSGRLSERKTLCIEEAFVIYIILTLFSPKNIIEIGTQYGQSTRRIIDMKNTLCPGAAITAFDTTDEVKHFTPDEARLILKDVTETFREDVLEAYKTGLIYLDARPYQLIKNIVQECCRESRWILAIHDCGPGLCNPRIKLNKNDHNVTSSTGVWERFVLAEAFGIKDPLSRKLDRIETPTHKMMVFSTPHGLAVILPKDKK